MNIESGFEYLRDNTLFFKKLREVEKLRDKKKQKFLRNLEVDLKSSAWATKTLFKPGIRNLYLQERLSAGKMVKKMQNFLGDQEYMFKFFFQNSFAKGKVPLVVELLEQGINLPRFRFRLESTTMLIELAPKRALIAIFNLLSGLDRADPIYNQMPDYIGQNFERLADAGNQNPKLKEIFKQIRMLLLHWESS
jgi:hypothetical protein